MYILRLTATEPIIVWGAGVDDNQTLRRQLLRSRNSTNVELCDILKLRPRQRRLCRRARGTAAALVEAARIAVLECRFQFMYDRWNCSLGAHAPKLFRKGTCYSSAYCIPSGDMCVCVIYNYIHYCNNQICVCV